MPKNQIMFYATAPDLGSVLADLEEIRSIQYVQTGLFKERAQRTYASFKEIPNFGRATNPAAIANPAYLVSVQGTEIHCREVPQRTGEIFFAVDQVVNPKTIHLQPGGAFGPTVILCGTVGTISQSTESKNLYKLAAKEFRKYFVRCQKYLVGPVALEMCRAGVRLTIGAASPTDFDLKL